MHDPQQLLTRLNALASAGLREPHRYYRDLGDETTWEQFISQTRAQLTEFIHPPCWSYINAQHTATMQNIHQLFHGPSLHAPIHWPIHPETQIGLYADIIGRLEQELRAKQAQQAAEAQRQAELLRQAAMRQQEAEAARLRAAEAALAQQRLHAEQARIAAQHQAEQARLAAIRQAEEKRQQEARQTQQHAFHKAREAAEQATHTVLTQAFNGFLQERDGFFSQHQQTLAQQRLCDAIDSLSVPEQTVATTLQANMQQQTLTLS